MSYKRYISNYTNLCKQIPENLKGRSKSSQDWLIRQLKDPYVEKAKMENYRCRSAFKLIEINSRHNILSPGMCVVDCGAAPGGWSQVAASKVNSDGRDPDKANGLVVSIDRLPIHSINGAVILGGCDFTIKENQGKILNALKGRSVDIVLSDMAPNASGVKHVDHDAILVLAYSVVRFSFEVCRGGGSLLIKLWDGGGTEKFINDLLKFYNSVKRVKPPASRSDSSEFFILARGFRGISKAS